MLALKHAYVLMVILSQCLIYSWCGTLQGTCRKTLLVDLCLYVVIEQAFKSVAGHGRRCWTIWRGWLPPARAWSQHLSSRPVVMSYQVIYVILCHIKSAK